jgi:hypothetical protein
MRKAKQKPGGIATRPPSRRRCAPPAGLQLGWPRAGDSTDQRHTLERGQAGARAAAERPAFQTSPHFLHRMYVTSGAVLALYTGSTAPQVGHAGAGGCEE